MKKVVIPLRSFRGSRGDRGGELVSRARSAAADGGPRHGGARRNRSRPSPLRRPATREAACRREHRRSSAGYDDLTPEERVSVAVYENVNRAVVNINTRSVQTDKFMLFEIPRRARGAARSSTARDTSSPNFHVVDGAREIQVTLFNGTNYEARMVGQDPSSDVAILKIEAPADLLFSGGFWRIDALKVGQRVLRHR